MKLDLTIGFDDLSVECQSKIKQLKVMGFQVELHYPTLKKASGLATFDWVANDGGGISIAPAYSTVQASSGTTK